MVNLIGKHVEFYQKIRLKDFEDPGKLRIGVVRKITRDYVYIDCLGFKYRLRVKKKDFIRQITHRFRRPIEW